MLPSVLQYEPLVIKGAGGRGGGGSMKPPHWLKILSLSCVAQGKGRKATRKRGGGNPRKIKDPVAGGRGPLLVGGAIFEVGVTSLCTFTATLRVIRDLLVILDYTLLLFLYLEPPLQRFTY